MPQFAARLNTIVTAEASQLLSEVKEMQRNGRDIAMLCVGEPDFDTHPRTGDAAKAAIDAGATKYAPLAGVHELRQAICDKLRRDNGLNFTVENVIACTGGKQVIYNAFMATLDPGDEVIVPAPYWAGYPDVIRICGAAPVFAETRDVDDFILRADTLECAISDRTKWLILNSPSNPTGAMHDRSDLEALADVLRRHPDIWILCDDIYEHIRFDDAPFVTLAQVAPDLKDRVLIANGCSKSYAMTGWRLGFGAGTSELIDRMITIQSQVTLAPSTISQWAAVRALEENLSIQGEQLATLLRRRDLAVSMLNQTAGLNCNRPKGAFYIYVNCARIIGRSTPDGRVIETDREFCRYLLDAADVAVMPGAAYGLSPYFRLSYAIDTEELERALARIQTACAALR
ncbi:pyridoxal phosphate-dependent aminotransferase [Pikeienuella piscinae]|uniref:Aminotransferase n=1 Tax=Pikeienuella piscinae TaxID=2748098 RepID=A0A7L5BT75_9RHOB|nr:pyridoxal phosphate-dependent aminotransferase [Pikeienuella piscinae]QIE55090.1 pyridoxal phosphate-dependent aminotransferase [Pikeienuella piscinae]